MDDTKETPRVVRARPPEWLEQFFAHDHLPPHLAAISRPFADLAREVIANLPSNPERTVALRKLLEAKDCAVRALLAGEVAGEVAR